MIDSKGATIQLLVGGGGGLAAIKHIIYFTSYLRNFIFFTLCLRQNIYFTLCPESWIPTSLIIDLEVKEQSGLKGHLIMSNEASLNLFYTTCPSDNYLYH